MGRLDGVIAIVAANRLTPVSPMFHRATMPYKAPASIVGEDFQALSLHGQSVSNMADAMPGLFRDWYAAPLSCLT